MNRTPNSSWTWTALVTLAVAASAPWVGCAPKVEVAPEAKYTPESLADELAFRFKDLGADAKKLKARTALKAPGKDVTKEKPEEQKKAGEASKKQPAPPSTADQILDEIAEKIQGLEGTSPAETCTRMAAAIRKSTLLNEADKEPLAKKLEQMAGK